MPCWAGMGDNTLRQHRMWRRNCSDPFAARRISDLSVQGPLLRYRPCIASPLRQMFLEQPRAGHFVPPHPERYLADVPTLVTPPQATGGVPRIAASRLSPGPVRVMHLVNRLEVGGTELNAVRTAEQLDADRVNLEVAILGPDGPMLGRYKQLGIKIHRLSIRNLYGFAAMAEARRFAHLMRARQIEVLHTHDVYANIFGVPAGRLAGVRGVLASRRWWKRVPRRGLLPLNRIAYAMAHGVLVNTDAIGRMLCREELVSSSKITVVPNFLESAAFQLTPRSHPAFRFAHRVVPEQAFVVGFVGRLNGVKDIPTLLQAMSLLPPHIGAHLVLVGDGPERATLEGLVLSLGISSSVHFLGEQPARPSYHQYFDVSVLCSLSEGLPNSALEAMAVGRPLVASAVGGVPDIVRHEETGLLFQPGDPRQLADHIVDLARNREVRHRIGERARDFVANGYSAEPVLERLHALYLRLARREEQ